MNYFNEYTSNTVGAGANQFYFNMEKDEVRTGRIIYKIKAAGEYEYSFLFSNAMDSTYSDGKASHAGIDCGEWSILRAAAGRCKIKSGVSVTDMKMGENESCDAIAYDFRELSFDATPSRRVMPNELFSSDAVRLHFDEGEYLCLEITYSGKMIPYHEETILPTFVKCKEEWKYDRRIPFPSMIGCSRKAEKRIVFLGDSITQGIGTRPNAYAHWCALLADKLGDRYSYWNLGIGYARATDLYTNGSWMYKAKQCDVAFVCCGVNDIAQGIPEGKIKESLSFIVNTLNENGVTVILQTLPPVIYQKEEMAEKGKNVNDYIRSELKEKVALLFDISSYPLTEEETHSLVADTCHPNEKGSAVWADRLYEEIKKANLL